MKRRFLSNIERTDDRSVYESVGGKGERYRKRLVIIIERPLIHIGNMI
jgi:hypothetical protein